MVQQNTLEETDSQQNADVAIQEALTLSGNPNEIERYYNKWANNYDEDVSKEQYQGTEYIANYFSGLQANNKDDESNFEILDAGCGTGLVGIALQQKGYHTIDGCDISDKMIYIAQKTRAYRSLIAGVDLNNMTSFKENQYAATISCGVFTQGHVPPTALEELIRVTKQRGVIVLSTRKSYYETTYFQTVCDRLENEGKIKVVSHVVGPYIAEEDAHYWAFKVC